MLQAFKNCVLLNIIICVNFDAKTSPQPDIKNFGENNIINNLIKNAENK
jgi:hypothetical protein